MRITLLLLLFTLFLSACRNKELASQHFSRAYNLSQDGDHAGAESIYTQAIELAPKNADAYSNRGYERYMLGRYEEAVSDYTRSLKLKKKKDSDGYVNRALAYEAMGDKQKATDDYKKALELNPLHGNALFYMGMLLHREGKHAEAMSYYERAARIAPENDQIWFYMGSIRYTEANYPEALAHFSQAAKLDPANPEALYWKGQAHIDLQEMEKALVMMDSTISLDPLYPLAYEARSYIHFTNGNYEQALQDGERSIRLGNVTPEVCIYIGNSARMLRYTEKAEEHLNLALKLDPTSYYAYWARGELYYDTRRDDKACIDLTKALELATNEEHRKRLQDIVKAYCN